VEDWTIENHTQEVHEFHMHQIHFQVIAVNGVPVPRDQRQWYDTYQVDYYSGTGKFPSITVRMDFRGADIGEFVYHCHILDHEDGGMMANILVLPKGGGGKHARAQEHQPSGTRLIKLGAKSAPSHA
jgi:FtsP/CotA-like multicopper oxidase with cupredoxin domain